MDADTLRLILIVAGGFLLLGLYLWERRRARPHEEEPFVDEALDEDKLEPQLGVWQEEQGAASPSVPGDDDPWEEPPELADPPESPDPPREPEQPEFELEPLEPAPAPDSVVLEGPTSPLILSLSITPIEGTFDGETVIKAAGECGIEPGDMDVFHCYSDPGSRKNPLFSMANMVNPGTFPFGDMAEFESPGLTLFSQAEGASDDPVRLEKMLATAHCLTERLNGEVRDETRALLTPAVEQRLRDRVRELVTWRLSDTEPG